MHKKCSIKIYITTSITLINSTINLTINLICLQKTVRSENLYLQAICKVLLYLKIKTSGRKYVVPSLPLITNTKTRNPVYPTLKSANSMLSNSRELAANQINLKLLNIGHHLPKGFKINTRKHHH